VILSPDFLRKDWTNLELDSLVAREGVASKVVLPIWHKVSKEDIWERSALLAGKFAIPTSRGLPHIVDQVVREVEAARARDEPAKDDVRRLKGSDVGHLLADFVQRLAEAGEHGVEQVTGVRTGFADLDRITSGLQPGTLVLVGGRPLSGKSTFAIELAQHVSLVEGLPVVLCMPGISGQQLTGRLVSMLAHIPPERLRTGQLRDDEWGRLSEAVDRIGKATLHIIDEPSPTVNELKAEVERMAIIWGAVGAVVVDSVQELVRDQAVDAALVCRKLKLLARELNCPVVVTTVLPRTVDLRPDKRPMLADLAEVGAIEHHIDVVLFTFRQQYPPQTELNLLELIVAKQRETGLTGTVDLAFTGMGRLAGLEPAQSSEA
jgi:replicative DNA helicase